MLRCKWEFIYVIFKAILNTIDDQNDKINMIVMYVQSYLSTVRNKISI